MKNKQIHEVKNQQQRKALNAWAKDDFIGSIIAGTGFGKSRCGVLAIKKLIQPGERALVLVPTTQLQDQFAEEFKKWDADDVLESHRYYMLSVSLQAGRRALQYRCV